MGMNSEYVLVEVGAGHLGHDRGPFLAGDIRRQRRLTLSDEEGSAARGCKGAGSPELEVERLTRHDT